MCHKGAYHSHRGRHHHHHWHQARKHWKKRFAMAWGQPPVNVEEFDDRYEIQVYAVGYTKDAFQVGLQDNTLIIAAEKPESDEGHNWRKREFRPMGFERQFELNDKVDKEAIAAKYEEGVLIVTLPKLEGFETVRQDIEIV